MLEVENALLKFIHLSEGLKNELRNGFTSTEKRESVAEHTWRVSLMIRLSKKPSKSNSDMVSPGFW